MNALQVTALIAVLVGFVASQLPPNSYCVPPSEQARCKVGAIGDETTCDALICYDNDSLCKGVPLEKKLFETGCFLLEGFAWIQNCEGKYQPFTAPGVSTRENAYDCYNGHGITIIHAARGGCEAGGCCSIPDGDAPLCDFESRMHFMSLGYGIKADPRDAHACNSSVEYFGNNTGCQYLTDGNSNDALLCHNIGAVTANEAQRSDLNFCHVSFAGTNDINDILAYAKQVFDPLSRREVTYGNVSFVIIESLASIALQEEDKDYDGIVEIVFQEAEAMGCFTRAGAAISIYGHSLGGSKADVLALMIGGYHPNVHVELTTFDAPALLWEPLKDEAAKLEVWDRKIQYHAGIVLPRGPVFQDFYLDERPYGFYQDYDFVSQVYPGGYYANGTGTKVEFLCEVLSADGSHLSYFLSSGWEGCAVGRNDLQNPLMPNFPHPGGLERTDGSNLDEELSGLIFLLLLRGILVDPDLVDAMNVIATIADVNLRDSFWMILDLHMMRRGLHFAHVLTENGTQCSQRVRNITIVTASSALTDPLLRLKSFCRETGNQKKKRCKRWRRKFCRKEKNKKDKICNKTK